MKKLVLIVLIVCLCSTFVVAQKKAEKPLIQIAILLDTSNSMDGLIHQAKTQLWKIVNELATTKKKGQIPELQVALYEYGKSSLSPNEGYLRMIVNLTTDLDKVSEELFAVKTNGGQEYCGWVIGSATQELAWSKSSRDFKAIFIAGNEPFTQGRVSYQQTCKKAIAKGIVVNTIHCGPYHVGVSGKWKHAAELADGNYMHIDQNRRAIIVRAPQDSKIMELSRALNNTYIPYGRRGIASKARQKKQDSNAKISHGAAVQRAVSKSSAHYRNESWDMVDAMKKGKVKLEEMEQDALPENMRKMNTKERKAYIQQQQQKRKQLQEKIRKLNSARKKYVAEKMKKLQASGKNTLDAVMIKTLHRQLKKKNFEIK